MARPEPDMADDALVGSDRGIPTGTWRRHAYSETRGEEMIGRGLGYLVAAGAAAATAAVYVTFSARVMPSLARLSQVEGVSQMQEFNRRAVQAPFMMAFFGAAIASGFIVAAWLRGSRDRAAALAAVAAVSYLIGFVITVVYNVPRNEELARVNPAAAETASVWTRYLVEWTRANTVRGVLSVVATASFVGAAVFSFLSGTEGGDTL